MSTQGVTPGCNHAAYASGLTASQGLAAKPAVVSYDQPAQAPVAGTVATAGGSTGLQSSAATSGAPAALPTVPQTPASTTSASVPVGADTADIISGVRSIVYGDPGGQDTFTKSNGGKDSGQPSSTEALANDALAFAARLDSDYGGSTGDSFVKSQKPE